jgi:hypothetical protein
MVTLAPLMTAPEGSLTEPTMLPVPMVVWASSGLPRLNRNKTVQSVKARIRLCFPAVPQFDSENLEPLLRKPDVQALLAEVTASSIYLECTEANGRI